MWKLFVDDLQRLPIIWQSVQRALQRHCQTETIGKLSAQYLVEIFRDSLSTILIDLLN